MKRILLTALLIVTANIASALQLSIQHNKDLPTPYELITKGKILNKETIKTGVTYIIDWDKTDDIYRCGLYWDTGDQLSVAKCYVSIQETKTGR